jgi:RNA polymerase sigma-70 factor (subfamily 1)
MTGLSAVSCAAVAVAHRARARRQGGKAMENATPAPGSDPARPISGEAAGASPNPPTQLEDLVRRAKAGDLGAQNQIVTDNLDIIRGLVRKQSGPKLKTRIEEDDLVQTAMIEVIRDLKKVDYRGRDQFFQWLSQLVQNKVRDKAEYFDRQKRDIRREKPLVSNDSTMTSTGGVPQTNITAKTRGPATRVEYREDQERLQRALRELPDDLRTIIIEKQYNNRSLREIADQLGISEGIVARRLVKALETLRRSLKGSDPAAST